MREASRLRRTVDVQRARTTGASRGDRMYMVSAADSTTSASRLAISVPKKIGIAVRRNRARRRARAAFGPLLERLIPPADLVVIVRGPALDAEFSALVSSAVSLLRALGRLGSAA